MAEHSCAYEIFVAGSAERAWDALTTPDMTAAWWAHRNFSDWRVGSRWEHRRLDRAAACDIAGEVVASERPALLALTWANPEDGTPVAGPPAQTGAGSGARLPSLVTFALEPHAAIVRLRVTHERLATAAEAGALLAGWAAVLSNLKSWLETGAPLPTAPWDMLPDFVR